MKRIVNRAAMFAPGATRKLVLAAVLSAFVFGGVLVQMESLRRACSFYYSGALTETANYLKKFNINKTESDSRPEVGAIAPRIALLSSYVGTRFDVTFLESAVRARSKKSKKELIERMVMLGNASKRISDKYLDYVINKNCYAELWGYDFILNTTFGFADGPFDKPGRPFWLQYGNWHRVPHIRAAINDYDWILYSDLDFVIKDLTRPIESFIKQWILYGKNNVHVFVPPKNKKSIVFSTFAILVRNSDFGRALLRNWEEFGRGLCPNGTFEVHNPAQMDILGQIKWEFTDQPGLWYALLQTSIDFDHRFEKGRRLYSKEFCDNETGFFKHLICIT